MLVCLFEGFIIPKDDYLNDQVFYDTIALDKFNRDCFWGGFKEIEKK